MSSTFLSFTPSTVAAFTFQATLGGTQCQVTITWNIFGQRYYLNVSDLSGNLILCRSMTATGPALQAQFSWALGLATALCAVPHNVPVGSCANVYVSQTDSGFDGSVQVLATGSNTLTYSLPTNPNEATSIAGVVNFNLNLLEGYDLGYLLYHCDTQQLEYG